MKRQQPLHLNIPQPCRQDWNNMPVNGDGRYCSQCTKTVLDFSGMTDAELLSFFETKPVHVCGRLRTAQLDREILPQQPKRLLPTLYHKATAALLAMLSFRFSTAQTQKKDTAAVVTQPAVRQPQPFPDSLILTGKVTQNYSQPVASAKVSFDGLLETYTDTDGTFRLLLTAEMIGNHNLYFSAAGLKRAVRNFSPAMGAAVYNVNLDSPN